MNRSDPRRHERRERAFNIAALAVVAAFGAWIAWSQAMRWAERRNQEARQLELEERERQRMAARPRLAARPVAESAPEGGNAHGPAACQVAIDLGDETKTSQWSVAATPSPSANAMPQIGPSNVIRFTMGDNRFALRRDAIGVKVSVKWQAFDPLWQGYATDVVVRLTSGGRPIGANKASGAVLPAMLAITDYGGAVDAWGNSAAIPADVVNAEDFGVEFVISTDSPMCPINIAGVEITAYEQEGDAQSPDAH